MDVKDAKLFDIPRIVGTMKTMKKTKKSRKDPDAIKTEYIEMRCEKSEKDAFRCSSRSGRTPPERLDTA